MASTQAKNSLIAGGVLLGLAGAVLWETGIIASLAGRLGFAVPFAPPGSAYDVMPLPASAPVLRVLFIGNSYTFVNDLPHMVQAIAASDSVSPVNIQVDEAVRGGARLMETWADQGARAKLASRHWDDVVLQEESLMTTRPDLIAMAQTGFGDWVPAVQADGARPVIYETWARQPGSQDYSNDIAATYHLTDAPGMQAGIDETLNQIGASLGAIVVPVGDAWMSCASQPGLPSLYLADGSHPSIAGAYLTGLLFYRVLTGHSPANVTFAPPGLDAATAGRLVQCAM